MANFAFAQTSPNTDFQCSNKEDCSIAAEGVSIAAALLGLTLAPLYFGPQGASRHFLKTPLEFGLGIGPEKARVGRLLVDANQLPDTRWGYLTKLELIAPKSDKQTELRFQAAAQYTFVRREYFRFGLSAGPSYARILEFTESFGGVALNANAIWDWSEKKKLGFFAGRIFQKRDATRAGFHLYYAPWSTILGYEFEDSLLTRTHSHFVYAGFASLSE